jgi:diaminopimelate decarboxylase
MIVRDLEHKRQRIARLLEEQHTYPIGDLAEVAAQILGRRAALLAAAGQHQTPFYLFDRLGFRAALRTFAQTFDHHLPRHRAFYAVKSNHHPLVVEEAVAQGFGLDVSSGREFQQALATAAPQILFSGPAKSAADLDQAVAHADRTIVNLDSFGELERLAAAATRAGRRIRAGVRVFAAQHGAWSKFGIPLTDLAALWRRAQQHPLVELIGIQSHLSWNRDARPYEGLIADLGSYLASQLTAEERARIRFIDVGGGYRPHRLEGYFPADHPLGTVIKAADDYFGAETEFVHDYYIKDSIPVGGYAHAIGAAIRRHLAPLLDCDYYTEPGRIVSTYAMHILLQVVDCKRDGLVIVDGGINMVGWERYLNIYCPVVNLTHPAPTELPVRIGGALCDCEDIWGMHCYAERVEEGDILIVPYQGAYTFCVAQEFIRAIPPVYELAEAPA